MLLLESLAVLILSWVVSVALFVLGLLAYKALQ